jgi:hypothetical protein
MKTSPGKLIVAALTAFVLTSLVMVPVAEAQRRGGGGSGARQPDARTNNVRSTSVNNVNVERNVNVNVSGGCSGRCGGWDHPVAAAAVVGGTIAVTAAAVGSMVAAPPPGCVPVNQGGVVYQQCGSTWYAPQGSQYVVVNPPY